MARAVPRVSVGRAAAVFSIAVAVLLSSGAVALASAGRGDAAGPPGGLTGATAAPLALPTACPDAFQNCAFLSLTTSGTGGGTTTSDAGSLDCSYTSGAVQAGACYAPIQWSANSSSLLVTLTLTPRQGSYACVTGVSCDKEGVTVKDQFHVTPNETKVVNLEYDVALHRLTIEMQGMPGQVTVGSTTCASTPCDGGLYPWGTDLQIKAAAAAGSGFLGWTGACATQPPTCTLSLTTDALVTAVFSGTPTSAPSATAKASSSPRPSPSPLPSGSPRPSRQPSPAPSAPASSPGSTEAGAASGEPAPTDAAASSASPAAAASDSAAPALAGQTTPAGPDSGSVPWLAMLVIVVIVVLGVNLLAYQVLRGRRRPGP